MGSTDMPTAPLAVEPFEDRTAPSRGGFGHGPPADHGFGHGPTPAHARDSDRPDGRNGPFVGFGSPRGGPILVAMIARSQPAGDRGSPTALVAARATAEAEPVAVAPRALVVARATAEPGEPAAPPTAAVLATPAGLVTVLPLAFFAPTNTRIEGTPPTLVTPTGSVPVRADAPPVSVAAPAASGGLAFPAAPAAGDVPSVGSGDPPPDTAPPPPDPPPAYDFTPLVVDVPGLVPLAGALGIDLISVEGGVRDVFDRLAALAEFPSDGTGATAWLTTAAVLAGGAGAAGYAGARAKRRAAELPINWKVRR